MNDAPSYLTNVDLDEQGLFDAAPYVTRRGADKITITFSGSVSFDGGDPDGEELFKKLQLGREVDLQVSGVVASVSGRYARSRDDDETITGVASIKLDSLFLPAPEQL